MENTSTKEKFSTLIKGLESLKSMGYTLEFTVQDEKMINRENDTELTSEDITIDEVYHFEGESSPNDRSTLYAISATKHNLKGTLVNGKGTAADEDVVEFLKKLDVDDAANHAETDKTAIAETDTSESGETEELKPAESEESELGEQHPNEPEESEFVKSTKSEFNESKSTESDQSESAKTEKSEFDETATSNPPESEVPMPPKNITTDTTDDTSSITTYNPDDSEPSEEDEAAPTEEKASTENQDETNMNATDQRPEGERTINASFLQMDLNKFIQQIKDESTWAESKHNSITIFKSDHLRLVLMGFHENAELKPHATKGIINLQVLHGAISFTVEEEVIELQQGQMIAVHENITHSLKANEESFVLLTLVMV